MLESRLELTCPFRSSLAAGQVNNNSESLIGSQLARPLDDIILDFRIEISFAEREAYRLAVSSGR